MSGPTPGALVVLTAEQLRELVRGEFDAALAEHAGQAAAPALLDRRALAGQLDISLPTLDRLRDEGMPSLRLGDSPRFELGEVLAWLRQKSTPAAGSHAELPAQGVRP